jgi:hypothetical protein
MDEYFGTYSAYKGATPKQAAILSRYFEAPSGAAAWFPRQSQKELSFSTGEGKLPAADGYVELPAAPSAPPAPKSAPKTAFRGKPTAPAAKAEVKQALQEVGADRHASLLNPIKAAVNLAGDAGVAVGKALKQARLDANRDESDTDEDTQSQRTRDLNSRRNAELLAAEARKQKEAAEQNERRIKHERETHAKREKELSEARERRLKEEEHAAAVEREHALAEQARHRASQVPSSMKSLGRWAGEQMGIVSPLTHEERRAHEFRAAQEHRKNAELEAHRLEDEAEQRHATAIRMEHEAAERRLAEAREKAEFHHRAADTARKSVSRVKSGILPASVLPPIEPEQPPSAPEVPPHVPAPVPEPEPAQARITEIKAEAKERGLTEEQIGALVFNKNGELHARSKANDVFKNAVLQEQPALRSGLRRRKV